MAMTANQQPGTWGPTPMPSWGAQPAPNPYPQTAYQPVSQPMPIQQTPAPFTGRFIEKLSDIVPNEVPMDGRVALFPSKTLEEIYLKMWNANGEMKTFRYILDTNQNFNAPQPPQSDSQAEIFARLDALEQQVRENSAKNGGQRGSSKGGEK